MYLWCRDNAIQYLKKRKSFRRTVYEKTLDRFQYIKACLDGRGHMSWKQATADNSWTPAKDLRGSECNYVVMGGCVSFIQITVQSYCSNQVSSAQVESRTEHHAYKETLD